jgi:predicted nucleic acid-binding Zn ribbon protein
MPQLACPTCGKLISVDAHACPKCGDPLKEGWTKKAQRKANIQTLIIGPLIAAPVGIIIYFSIMGPAQKTEGERREQVCRSDRNLMAYIRAKEVVRQRLKSPSTAEFPDSNFTSVQTSPCVFKVNGFVDAQNAFGAKIRAPYSLEIEYSPSKDSWTTRNVRVD